MDKDHAMTGPTSADESAEHWWGPVERMFDTWLAEQSDEVQELGLLEQIDLYAAAHDTTRAQGGPDHG